MARKPRRQGAGRLLRLRRRAERAKWRQARQTRGDGFMSDISLIIEAPLARIRLDRPPRRNAMTRAMWRALPDLCARVAATSEALVVILEGAGGHFCAGADISEFDVVYRDAAAARDYYEAMQEGLGALAALDRPTIAALRGAAIGGGLALALCCDLRFCADDAFLAITPARLGILYGFVETRRLVQTIGPARARDLLFSGRRVACVEALAIGLIDRLVAAESTGGDDRRLCERTRVPQPIRDSRRQARRRGDRRRPRRGELRLPRDDRTGRRRRRFRRGAVGLPGEARAAIPLSRPARSAGLAGGVSLDCLTLRQSPCVIVRFRRFVG